MSKWNKLDLLIAQVRYRAIEPYAHGDVVCDIGCGQEAAFLKQYSFRFREAYGIDHRISDQVIGNIVLKNNRNTDLIELPDNFCDTVFMLALLEHLEKPQKMFDEAYRILKPNGVLVLTTPTRAAKPVLEIMAFQLHMINREEILEHKHYYSKDEIYVLFEKCGFCDPHYRTISFGMNSIAMACKTEKENTLDMLAPPFSAKKGER